MIIVDEEAEIVRFIFSLYVDGYGYKAITNRLNHFGYKTKKDANFSITSVRGILSNCTYAGYIQFNKNNCWSEKRRKGKNDNPVINKGEHIPIIDELTWFKAQELMKFRSHKSPKTFTGHFPLTTLLRCPICGHGMIGHKNKSKNGTVYIRYYQCGNFHRKGSAVCSANSVRADEIEEEVFNRIENLLSNSAYLDAVLEDVNQKVAMQKQPLVENLNYVNSQIHSINSNVQKYLSLFEDNKIQSVFILERFQSLQEELRTLKAHKVELEMHLTQPKIQEISKSDIQLSLEFFSDILPKASPEKQKALLHSIISRITITPANKINNRKLKDIELYFDTTIKDERVLTYDTVPPA